MKKIAILALTFALSPIAHGASPWLDCMEKNGNASINPMEISLGKKTYLHETGKLENLEEEGNGVSISYSQNEQDLMAKKFEGRASLVAKKILGTETFADCSAKVQETSFEGVLSGDQFKAPIKVHCTLSKELPTNGEKCP